MPASNSRAVAGCDSAVVLLLSAFRFNPDTGDESDDLNKGDFGSPNTPPMLGSFDELVKVVLIPNRSSSSDPNSDSNGENNGGTRLPGRLDPYMEGRAPEVSYLELPCPPIPAPDSLTDPSRGCWS